MLEINLYDFFPFVTSTRLSAAPASLWKEIPACSCLSQPVPNPREELGKILIYRNPVS